MAKRFKHRFSLNNCLFGSVRLTKNADPDKYKYSITDESVITCDEIIKETKTVPTFFNETKVTYLHFLFTMELLIAVSICNLI